MSSPKLRLATLLAVVALVSLAIIGVDAYVLPRLAASGLVQMSSSDLASIVRTIAGVPASGSTQASGSAVALRPFGVHRGGLDEIPASLGSFAVLATASAALLYLVPRRVRNIADALSTESHLGRLRQIILGATVYLLSYAILRLSWLTVFAMPLMPILLTVAALATLFGLVAVSFSLGRRLLRSVSMPAPPLAQMLLGLWIIFIFGRAPYVGWVLAAAAASAGLGGLVQSHLGDGESWSLNALEDDPAESAPPNVVKLRRLP